MANARLLVAGIGLAAVLSVATVDNARAAAPDNADAGETEIVEPVSDDGWEFSVTPYFWMTGVAGDIGVSPDLPVATVDMSFGDVLDLFQFGLMATADASKGRFVASTDMMYADLGTTEEVAVHDPSFTEARLGSETFIVTALAGYRFVDQGPLKADVLAGARLTYTDMSLELIGPNRTAGGIASDTWIDPVIAARVQGPLGGKWSYSAYGDIGGFGVGSDLTWQLAGKVDYRIGRAWTLSVGWRHMEIDYENDGFLVDVAMDGPVVGGTFRF